MPQLVRRRNAHWKNNLLGGQLHDPSTTVWHYYQLDRWQEKLPAKQAVMEIVKAFTQKMGQEPTIVLCDALLVCDLGKDGPVVRCPDRKLGEPILSDFMLALR